MKLQNYYIINKSGGLIYSHLPSENINLDMVMSSYIHTLNAHIIDLQLTEQPDIIIPIIITMNNKVMTVYTTFTNYTFIFLHDKAIEYNVFVKFYELFANYALKDPFYAIEMPVNSVKFNKKSSEIIDMFT